MKKLSMLLIAILVLSFVGMASAARLIWDEPVPCGDPNTCPVEGYNIYYGVVGMEDVYKVTVTGATEQQLVPLRLSLGKTYRFAVSAYNAAGESAQSNSVEYTVPQYQPGDDVLPDNELVIIIPGTVRTLRFELAQ